MDGTVLAYQSGHTLGTADELNIAGPDGWAPRVVPEIDASEYALSPDGTQVAWFKPLTPITDPSYNGSMGSRNEVRVSPISGGPGTLIAPQATGPHEFYQFPVWSPDGRSIAFAGSTVVFQGDNSACYRSAIYVVGADGSNLRRLTARAGTDFIGISWSPDSRYVAYVGLPDGSPSPSISPGGGPQDSFYPPLDVFVIAADGTGIGT